MPRALQVESINSNSSLTFSTSSTGATIERLRIDSSGNVGIGTASPSDQLHINKSSNATIRLQSSSNTCFVEGNNNYLDLHGGSQAIRMVAGSTERLRIDSSGNVGIGTANPQSTLHVSASQSAIRLTDTNGTANTFRILAKDSTTNAFRIYDDTAAAERLRINSSGNIGIGTASPGVKLDVAGGSARVQGLTNPTSGSGIEFGYDTTQGVIQSYSNRATSTQAPLALDNASYKIRVGGADKILIDSSGNVGIGVSPIDQLSIGGTGRINLVSVITDTTSGIYFYTAGNTSYAIHRTAGAWTAGTYQQLRMGFDTGLVLDGGTGHDRSFVRVDGTGIRVATGNIGIGTSTKDLSYKLDVYGTNGTDCARIYSSGASSGIDFWDSGIRRGLVYSDGNGFGFLNSAAGWALRVNHGTYDVVIPNGSLTLGKDIITNANYGYGHVGLYSEARFQSVFAMGTPYTMRADGTSLSGGAGGNNFYGIAWSYGTAPSGAGGPGGQAANLTTHGALFVANGATQTAISSSIWCIGNITAYSDERVKTNWRNFDNNFVEKLAKVKSGIFDRTDVNEKENGFKTQVGVSAQSLKEVIPDAVTCNSEGMLSVSYGNAAMVSCVELAKEILKLKEEIGILKNK